jgi:hypothetical protein
MMLGVGREQPEHPAGARRSTGGGVGGAP